MEDQTPPKISVLRQIPSGVWALGFVSMFMDISSEMIHALLPLFLVTAMGTSVMTVGLIEGIAEATASITKVFSGALSDWLGKRKLLAALGYGLAAVTKPVFPLAGSVGWMVAARFVDRVGKGIRGAPRDALLADITPEHMRGASFGLRQSLDTVGAFIGPLAAIGLMLLSGDNYRLVFWIAVVPAFISLALILFAVKEPVRHKAESKPKLRFADIVRMNASFWIVVAVASVLTLARFSEAFLILRAQNVGFPTALIPAIMVVMNVVYSLSSYPAGVMSDKFQRGPVLLLGVAFLVVADLVLALGATIPMALLGVVFWGLHMGFTQGLLSALVADTAPPALRGTAFGLFNLATGLVLLLASVVAGGLWDAFGPRATFLAGAAFTAIALAGLLLIEARRRRRVASGAS